MYRWSFLSVACFHIVSSGVFTAAVKGVHHRDRAITKSLPLSYDQRPQITLTGQKIRKKDLTIVM